MHLIIEKFPHSTTHLQFYVRLFRFLKAVVMLLTDWLFVCLVTPTAPEGPPGPCSPQQHFPCSGDCRHFSPQGPAGPSEALPSSWDLRYTLGALVATLPAQPGNKHWSRWTLVWPCILQSVRLHAHLSQITAIVRLCCSIRQLLLSEYTCCWENQINGRSMYPTGTLGGTRPISTSGNRATSHWPLYVTSCLGIRERWRTKSEKKLHLCTFRKWRIW